jgi:hypothetical protein
MYVVLTFKDDIFRSDFLRSFMQFQYHKYLIQTNFGFIVCYDIDNVHNEIISIQKLINIDCRKLAEVLVSITIIRDFNHVKQTAENRRPSKMGDVATLLFGHFNFIVMKSTERHFFQNTECTYHCIIMYIFKKTKTATPDSSKWQHLAKPQEQYG